jgi:hypothetical protein
VLNRTPQRQSCAGSLCFETLVMSNILEYKRSSISGHFKQAQRHVADCPGSATLLFCRITTMPSGLVSGLVTPLDITRATSAASHIVASMVVATGSKYPGLKAL